MNQTDSQHFCPHGRFNTSPKARPQTYITAHKQIDRRRQSSEICCKTCRIICKSESGGSDFVRIQPIVNTPGSSPNNIQEQITWAAATTPITMPLACRPYTDKRLGTDHTDIFNLRVEPARKKYLIEFCQIFCEFAKKT